MKKQRRDWGGLLTAFDGRVRPPVCCGRTRREPLSVLLERHEAEEHVVNGGRMRQGELFEVGASSDTNDTARATPTSREAVGCNTGQGGPKGTSGGGPARGI